MLARLAVTLVVTLAGVSAFAAASSSSSFLRLDDVRFRVIAAGPRSRPPTNDSRPTARVARSPRERLPLTGWVPEAAPEMMSVDLRSGFLVAVFAGWRPTSGYAINVDRVSFARLSSTRRQLCIVVTESQPSTGERVLPAVTAPFAVVAVSRKPFRRAGVPRIWALRDAHGTRLAAARGARPERCA